MLTTESDGYQNTDNSIESKDNLKEYIDIYSFNMHLIPDNLSISTMSITCFLGTLLNTYNIYKYIELERNNIVCIKSGYGIKCLPEFQNNFKSMNKNSLKNFFNQMTIIINVNNNIYLNVKLFHNGSIQITGCKELNYANIILNKLINKLKEILILKNNDITTEIKFIDDNNNLNISRFKIDLINTNFGMKYSINRERLYNILTEERVQCRISSTHACVNIKHKISENTSVSIFVFQTGNIIITGAKCAEHVRDTYYYILKYLNRNKHKIIKKNINTILNNEDVIQLLNI